MRKPFLLILLCLATASLAFGALPTRPNDREWNAIATDYNWIESLRKAQAPPSPNATRKQRIESLLTGLQKLEPSYGPFMQKLDEYYVRTGDPRAAQLLAREKIIVGDQYVGLARYDRAIELYREALIFVPDYADAKSRIDAAEQRRFVSMNAFAQVKTGMKEDAVRGLVGDPREDWIKQVVQNNRAYSVWIFPKADGGAAAIYFDNGVVYHTNWNAAAPAAQTPGK